MPITQSITVLPTPPSRADPENFDNRADAFLGALPTMQTQMNTWAGQANSTASDATSAAGTATTQAGTATTQAGIATTQAGIATTQAGIATTQAGTATTQAGTATTQAGIATTQAGIATTKAGEAAASAALAVDVVSGGLVSLTPTPNKIPIADDDGEIPLGWFDLTGYAPAANGVTNGDSHDHNGGDGAQIAYSSLSGLPTLGTAAATASTDYAPAAKGVTNGDSHDHNGGDGAQIAYSSLSGLPTLGTAAATASTDYAPAASVVAHAATEDPHPLLDSRLIGQLGYLLDQIALETKRNVAQDAALASHESSNDDAIEATTGTLTYALDLISVVAKAVTGGRAAFLGGSAATPAITIGNAGIYQSAADTLSVALAGSEVLRVTTTGIKCVGGSVTAL